MSAWIPYLAYKGARAAWRGVRSFAGSRAGAAAANKVIGAATGSLAGMAIGAARRAMRRRRHARAVAFMKSYRQKSALGLGNTAYLSSMKFPLYNMKLGASTNTTLTVRINPLHAMAETSTGVGFPTLWKADDRFKAMCGLYKKFRIMSMSINLSCDIEGLEALGEVSLVARVIRNCTNATPFTTFRLEGATSSIDIPGVIWKRRFDNDRTLTFKINLRPRSTLEKLQWYSTQYSADGNSVEFASGTQMDFAPCVDFALVVRNRTTTEATYIPCNAFIRYGIVFREADEPPSTSSTAHVAVTSENLVAMENAVKVANAQIPSVMPPDETVDLDL